MADETPLRSPQVLPTPRKTRRPGKYHQGYYTLKHPEKYVGDTSKIRYMSSWELHLHEFFDNNPHVLRWASEEIAIPYVKPTDGKIHRYFPDYWVEFRNKNGDIVQEIIELKPKAQTKAPRAKSKRKLVESVQLAINIAKWKSAQEFCKQRGIAFRIVTETSIFK